jgi:hypothetical protein
MKLNVRSFALAAGIIVGLAVFAVTAWFLLFNYPGYTLHKLHKIYIGYSVTWPGALLGLAWGFVEGFIAGGIFAWLYNRFTGK